MYENGKKLNKHAKNKIHQRILKERYMEKYYYSQTKRPTNWNKFAEEYFNKWNEAPDWWNEYYLTGPRQLAKRIANRKIRQMFNQLSENDYEDAKAPTHGDYGRMTEYDYTVW